MLLLLLLHSKSSRLKEHELRSRDIGGCVWVQNLLTHEHYITAAVRPRGAGFDSARLGPQERVPQHTDTPPKPPCASLRTLR